MESFFKTLNYYCSNHVAGYYFYQQCSGVLCTNHITVHYSCNYVAEMRSLSFFF